jgi:hypothetical protein
MHSTMPVGGSCRQRPDGPRTTVRWWLGPRLCERGTRHTESFRQTGGRRKEEHHEGSQIHSRDGPCGFAARRRVTKSGPCSAASTWKLSLKPDAGQIEVQFEVDQNVVGDTWNVRMTDNGTQIFKGKRVTQAPSGSFEVRKLTANLAGTDHIVGKATNPATGEVCRGAASI